MAAPGLAAIPGYCTGRELFRDLATKPWGP